MAGARFKAEEGFLAKVELHHEAFKAKWESSSRSVMVILSRSQGENKFIMRFPSLKKVDEIAHFKKGFPLSIVVAIAKVEDWKSSAGARMVLPYAWFQIRGVPRNYRNTVAVSYVGSLVVLTQEVDEETIDKIDYVRANIRVMDLERVPVVAPGVLEKCVYDFHYQREVSEEEFNRKFVQQSERGDDGQKGKEADENFDPFSSQFKNVNKNSGRSDGNKQEGFMKDAQRKKDDEAAATADGDASDDEILINLIRKKARTTPQKPSAATQEKAKEKTHVKAKKKTPVKAKKKTPVKAKKKIPMKNTAAKEKAKKKTPVKKTTFTGKKTSKNVPFASVIPPPPSPPAVQPATGAKRSLLYWLGG
ncbi:hypothetical protein ACQ4PT_011300 [Festuca glaucescens]